MSIKKKRLSPEKLVTSAAKTGSWYDRLSDTDKDYVDDVIMVLQKEPHVSIKSVAKSLIEELGINHSVNAVEYILRKML